MSGYTCLIPALIDHDKKLLLISDDIVQNKNFNSWRSPKKLFGNANLRTFEANIFDIDHTKNIPDYIG